MVGPLAIVQLEYMTTCRHWRMLVSAPVFAGMIPSNIFKDSTNKTQSLTEAREKNTIVLSAMINVAEFFGLRPDLNCAKKVLYFHENQLEYPKSCNEAEKSKGQSSFNLVYNQIISCFVVDEVYFNSKYNMTTFLEQIDPFMNKIPKSSRPESIKRASIEKKCKVLYIPITAPLYLEPTGTRSENLQLHVVWAHRWEHDKDPEMFMRVILELGCIPNLKFSLSVLGQQVEAVRNEFELAEQKVKDCPNISILNWGGVESRTEFLKILRTADVAVSTARHEFYGLSMLEACTCGAFPLVPKRLSYPELFPAECMYTTERSLLKKLRHFIRHPEISRRKMKEPTWTRRMEKFQWSYLKHSWNAALVGDSTAMNVE